MAQFSITEAAFTGFRVVRERPAAVLGWALLQFVLLAGSLAILIQFAGKAMAQLQAKGFAVDQAGLTAFMEQAARGEPLSLGLSLIVGAVLSAAMNRAVLQPQDKRFAYLRLGVDELAQLSLRLVLLVLWIAANLVLAALAQGLAALSALGDVGRALAALGDLVITVGAIVGLIYVGLRLSLASAATFAHRRLDLRTSWTLTHGETTQILMAFFLALVMSAIVLGLGLIIVGMMDGALATVLDPRGVLKPDLSSLQALVSSPPMAMIVLFSLTGMSLLAGLMSPLLTTPLAFIYQRLAASAPRTDIYA